jgi:undecaprenyl-diphosphatase
MPYTETPPAGVPAVEQPLPAPLPPAGPASTAAPRVRILPPPASGYAARLAAADRAFLARVAGAPRTELQLRLWRGITHLGGARATTVACAVPLLAGAGARRAGLVVTAVVLLTQLVVHLVKRLVGRPRPARGAGVRARAAEPDQFSFPSGHAATAMAVALGYGAAAPRVGPALVLVALVVGLSRTVLGVHYLGDVLAGVLLAAASAGVVQAAGPVVAGLVR